MDNQREEAQHNEELQGSGTNYRAKEQNWDNVMGYNQGQVYGGGVGFNSGALGFGNVNWSGGIGFNPIMQMQTGMATPGWGNYPNIMGKLWIRQHRRMILIDCPQVCQGWR